VHGFRRSRIAAKDMPRLMLCFTAACLWGMPANGQVSQRGEYPDKPAGLEKLAREILKAESRGEAERTADLLNGLLLPDSLAWYSTIFDENTAGTLSRLYESDRARHVGYLQEFFSRSQRENFTEVQALRYEKTCDDSAGEQIFGVLFARNAAVPLYELRLRKEQTFLRLWAVAYVDGAFRYVGLLRVPNRMMEISGRKAFAAGRGAAGAGAAVSAPSETEAKKDAPKRMRVSLGLQEAKLIHRETPRYPEAAVREHLEGTVHIHAIIGEDGTLRAMQVMSGYCSLAESAVAAVEKWRYKPTLLEGQAVEVETYIDVNFQLHP